MPDGSGLVHWPLNFCHSLHSSTVAVSIWLKEARQAKRALGIKNDEGNQVKNDIASKVLFFKL